MSNFRDTIVLVLLVLASLAAGGFAGMVIFGLIPSSWLTG